VVLASNSGMLNTQSNDSINGDIFKRVRTSYNSGIDESANHNSDSKLSTTTLPSSSSSSSIVWPIDRLDGIGHTTDVNRLTSMNQTLIVEQLSRDHPQLIITMMRSFVVHTTDGMALRQFVRAVSSSISNLSSNVGSSRLKRVWPIDVYGQICSYLTITERFAACMCINRAWLHGVASAVAWATPRTPLTQQQAPLITITMLFGATTLRPFMNLLSPTVWSIIEHLDLHFNTNTNNGDSNHQSIITRAPWLITQCIGLRSLRLTWPALVPITTKQIGNWSTIDGKAPSSSSSSSSSMPLYSPSSSTSSPLNWSLKMLTRLTSLTIVHGNIPKDLPSSLQRLAFRHVHWSSLASSQSSSSSGLSWALPIGLQHFSLDDAPTSSSAALQTLHLSRAAPTLRSLKMYSRDKFPPIIPPGSLTHGCFENLTDVMIMAPNALGDNWNIELLTYIALSGTSLPAATSPPPISPSPQLRHARFDILVTNEHGNVTPRFKLMATLICKLSPPPPFLWPNLHTLDIVGHYRDILNLWAPLLVRLCHRSNQLSQSQQQQQRLEALWITVLGDETEINAILQLLIDHVMMKQGSDHRTMTVVMPRIINIRSARYMYNRLLLTADDTDSDDMIAPAVTATYARNSDPADTQFEFVSDVLFQPRLIHPAQAPHLNMSSIPKELQLVHRITRIRLPAVEQLLHPPTTSSTSGTTGDDGHSVQAIRIMPDNGARQRRAQLGASRMATSNESKDVGAGYHKNDESTLWFQLFSDDLSHVVQPTHDLTGCPVLHPSVCLCTS
jgi:hypothetical protein